MYNQFVADISSDLNETFAYFKTEGITELILDLDIMVVVQFKIVLNWLV